MKLFKFIPVLVLCVITEATEKGIPVGPIPNGSTPAPAPPTTAPTSSTKPPTTPPVPTTKPPTPPAPTTAPTTASTTRSTTVTTKPTTTTAPPTTSKTTPVPTTTAKPPSTTPAPNPSDPVVGSWNITKPGTNIKCIMSKMALQIEVDYEEKNQTRKAVLNVPANATANGTCDNDKRNILLLTWSDELHNFTNSITFSFFNNTNTSQISLDNILVNLNGLHTPNETDPMNFMYNRTVFEAPLKHSYKCNKDQTLTLTNPKNDSNCKATLKVSHLQIQAFRTSNSTDFGDAIDCISSTPDIVPIAVGCALAALVVIVLLAYLYGRRRSQARGYLSMFAENKQEEDYIPMKTLSCFR